eukprot:702021-Alexandrium_andersonii.AAC.1
MSVVRDTDPCPGAPGKAVHLERLEGERSAFVAKGHVRGRRPLAERGAHGRGPCARRVDAPLEELAALRVLLGCHGASCCLDLRREHVEELCLPLGAPAFAALTWAVAHQVALDVLEGVKRHELRPRLPLVPEDSVEPGGHPPGPQVRTPLSPVPEAARQHAEGGSRSPG